MSFLLKKTWFVKWVFRAFYPVRNLSANYPNTVLIPSAILPYLKMKKGRSVVRNLSADCPKPFRNLSTQKRKKQTTPFWGMARPYYSLPTSLFPSFPSSFHLSYLNSFKPLIHSYLNSFAGVSAYDSCQKNK